MTKVSTELRPRLLSIIQDQNLLHPGDCLIVAISGGADSTALLHLLANLKTYSLQLVAGHLNHCLRGEESNQDEEFCRSLATSLAIRFESRRVDVKAMAEAQGLNLEDAGRRARQAFLDELKERYQATAIALAHHRDDQAETVLMRLLRGSGATGLSGMAFKNGRGYIRPLLGFSRAEIEAYLDEHEIAYRVDNSNLDTTFLRNRIRHELLPFLEGYNPAVREALTTCATVLAEEDKLLQELTAELFSRCCTQEKGWISCDLRILKQTHPSLRRRLYRQVFRLLTGSLERFSSLHVAGIEQLVSSTRPNSTLNVPFGIVVGREYDRLIFSPEKKKVQLEELVVSGPGRYALSNGIALTIEQSAPADHYRTTEETAIFDLDAIPFPWRIRAFQPGDRMTPLGMNGSKKIKDIFIDAKVPVSQRHRIPLVFCGNQLIWACGVRRSEVGKVSGSSVNIVSAVIEMTKDDYKK